MEQLRQLATRGLELIRAWRTQNPQLFKLLAGTLGLAAVILGGFYLFDPGAPIVIASNLTAADRTALALRLRRHQIDFTLGADSLTVPSSEAAEAQRLLAASPGFAGGAQDFSLFDHSTMGQSDFDEQVNYQRSLQGELERTIMDIQGVDSARVLLAMGRPSPFALGPSEAARASVMLSTVPGAVIDPAMARAIAHLVAGSVRGLTAEDVVITGNDGAILYPPQRDGEYGTATRLRDDLEHRLQEKIALLLNRIMGENRFAAEVAVAIDTSRVTSRDQIFGKGDQTVLSEEHQITPADAQIGGVPGVTSNLPVAPSLTPSAAASPPAVASPAAKGTPVATGAVVGSAEHQSADAGAARKDIVNYKPSSREISTVTAPVRIRRITVAVVLDGTYEGGHFKALPPERLDAIRGLLLAAVGAENDRGDTVEVQSAPLSQPYVPPVPNPMTQLRELLSNPTHLYEAAGAALVLLVLVLWVIKRALSRLFGRKGKSASGATVPAPAGAGDEAIHGQPATGDAAAPAAADAAEPPVEPARSAYDELRAKLNEEVDRDPRAAAEILRQWLELEESDESEAGFQQ